MDEIQPKSPTSVTIDQISFDMGLTFSRDAPQERTQFKFPYQENSLPDYFFRHLGAAGVTINENDRHFNDFESLFHATVVHLNRSH